MENKKQTYEPPVISRIKIMVAESVLAPCKTTVSDFSGELGNGCNSGQCKKVQGS